MLIISLKARLVHPSVHPSVHLCDRPSVRPTLRPSVRPFVRISSAGLPDRLSVRPSVRPSIHWMGPQVRPDAKGEGGKGGSPKMCQESTLNSSKRIKHQVEEEWPLLKWPDS